MNSIVEKTLCLILHTLSVTILRTRRELSVEELEISSELLRQLKMREITKWTMFIFLREECPVQRVIFQVQDWCRGIQMHGVFVTS
jgi:hypothetical protein